MNTDINHSQENMLDKFMKYFAIVMAIGYVAGGILLITLSPEALVIPKVHAIALSIILTGYGVYRGFRIYQKHYQQKYEN